MEVDIGCNSISGVRWNPRAEWLMNRVAFHQFETSTEPQQLLVLLGPRKPDRSLAADNQLLAALVPLGTGQRPGCSRRAWRQQKLSPGGFSKRQSAKAERKAHALILDPTGCCLIWRV